MNNPIVTNEMLIPNKSIRAPARSRNCLEARMGTALATAEVLINCGTPKIPAGKTKHEWLITRAESQKTKASCSTHETNWYSFLISLACL